MAQNIVPPLNLSQLPKLPGMPSSSRGPRASPRGQGFTVVNGVFIDADGGKAQRSGVAGCLSARSVARDHFLTTSREMTTNTARAALPLSNEPAFIARDRQVLRFFGFFKETVPESALETVRVRHVAVHYYLEDGTMELTEPREVNSGLLQGKFLKRMALSKPDGSRYTWSDLSVNMDFHAAGRVLRLVDADEFTRQFYAEAGCPLDAKNEEVLRMQPTRPTGAGPAKKRNPLRQFAEARLGRVTHQSSKTAQFLQNDRKVLRFSVELDDRERLYGDLRTYTLNFFLADSTMELKEEQVNNSGRDPFPLLLARQRCPKAYSVTLGASTDRSVPDDAPAGTYFAPEDLRVGTTISVYARPLKLVDCDEFTRQWYREELGVVQAAPINTRIVTEPPPRVPTPPHTGFGTEEDSRAACESLVPKARKHDFTRFVEHANTVLRFSADLVDAEGAVSSSRKFVVMVFLADETVQIFEPVQRNSGVMGGRFLQRGRHKNPAGEYYGMEAFRVGSVVSFNAHNFRLSAADEFTNKFLERADQDSERNARGFARQSELAVATLQKVREALARSGAVNGLRSLRRRFDALDLNGNGTLTADELALGLREVAGLTMTGEERDAVFAVFDRDGSGALSVDELHAQLRGGLNMRRRGLVAQAFDVLERDGDGRVTVDDLRGRFDFGSLPAVASGQRTTAQAVLDFLQLFDSAAPDGVITHDEFVDYYKDISALIDDDDYFELTLRNAWRIPGGTGAAANSANPRVLVVHSNAAEEIVCIQDAMGMDRGNLADVKARLKAQGVRDIAKVSFC